MTAEIRDVLIVVVPVLIALAYAIWKREDIAKVIGKFLSDKVAVGLVRGFLIKRLGGDENAKILADRIVGLADLIQQFTPDNVDIIVEELEDVVRALIGQVKEG